MSKTTNANARPAHGGRGLFYHRDSGGKHEMTPGHYVEWAALKCAELGLRFTGTPAAIDAMIRDSCAFRGDLFLDYDVKGNTTSRPGLNAMLAEIERDRTVSHVLIRRRDRLMRPDELNQALELEAHLRVKLGVTLVFENDVAPAQPRGKQVDIGEFFKTIIQYHQAQKDRRDLASKILSAQLTLARAGFSTGGRPSYGFRRWLVQQDGTPVRELAVGEVVRMSMHHVILLPTAEHEIAVRLRILRDLKTTPATQLARILNDEGVPSPDYGKLRRRKRDGAMIPTKGIWNATTITKFARDPLNVALVPYGRRSAGDVLRFSAIGPRELSDADYADKTGVRVIRNPVDQVVIAPGKFDALLDPGEHVELLAILDRRGGTQRGKPRSRTPGSNPLGTRIFDMCCGWPMYRQPYNRSFRYTCGLYQQSHGQCCAHNHVDGLAATRLALSCVQQRALNPKLLAKLGARLREIATAEASANTAAADIASKRAALATVRTDLEGVTQNLARAKSQAQYNAIQKVFEELQARERMLTDDLAAAEATWAAERNPEKEVRAALDVAAHLTDLAGEVENLVALSQLFQEVNVQMFVTFRDGLWGRRKVRRPSGGVITFGAAPAPIELYQGRTDRKSVKGVKKNSCGAQKRPLIKALVGQGGGSSGNVNQGDRI